MDQKNIILNSDSYKISMYKQYPPNTTRIFSYVESRGGDYNDVIFYGLQIFIKEYLSKQITSKMIDDAEEIINLHGFFGNFNRQGWEHIVNKHNGYLPVIIRAVPEGLLIPTKNVLVTIENTDPECYWLTTYLETSMLRAIWYPSTVATISKACKNIIKKYLEETADSIDSLPFKLHCFGFRGVSSFESAGIGNSAHLVNFMGTDTIAGLLYAKHYYGCDMAGYSINAAEHSTITTWGRDHEIEAYKNMLKQFAKPGSFVAVVSDSYDIFNAVENLWGNELREKIIESGATIVIRPDSGNPSDVVWRIAHLLADSFGHTVNSKGYKVLNHVRIIQGDGINQQSIEEILARLRGSMFSADNISFGMGGALLQKCDRDTLRWAMKCSSAEIDGSWIDVFKDPITDNTKASKKGRITLYRNKNTGEYITNRIGQINTELEDVLETVFLNGKVVKEYNFKEVRENSNK